MPTPVPKGTRDIPLQFAKRLTDRVTSEFSSGDFLERVTPITRDLLRFWFEEAFCETRMVNFHIGQKQAILNTIYVHEILKILSVFEMYEAVDQELLAQMDLVDLKKSKYQHPKYTVKMATGTGKTWVIEALLIWQYLNAKSESSVSGRFSKNFLLVTPGLIIYERLLNAFLGKQNEEGKRIFEHSDFKRYESLFLPPPYRDEIFGFIQNAVCAKDDIGRKVTGEGIIAITNWHRLAGDEEEEREEASPLEDPSKALKELIPITPGISQGHALEQLDRQFLRGNELEFLAQLKDLVVINDEAHHIHPYGKREEVKWQKSLNYISESKKERFIQIDFSATPYDVTGSGQKSTKHYFPHIVVDFDLRTAIHLGLVKTIALDRRKEIASLPLDFKAERNGGEVTGLSHGQKVMLRAGLSRLKILEEHFVKFTQDKEGVTDKYPKMFVICEDTQVAPKVVEYLIRHEGLDERDIIQIDSDKKGSIPEKEWNEIKQRLFDVDLHSYPKVIVSVLMLREGFDVNNICVIVPLRSAQAPILLEQMVGRGLRQMWREPEFEEMKRENRELLLQRKREPKTYMDILSIIEHPAFAEFHDDLFKELPSIQEDPKDRESVLGDFINVGLKPNYQDYDLYFPIILNDREENLVSIELSIDSMESFSFYSLEQLKKMVPQGGDIFYSEEITVKTRFGDYEVKADTFNSKSYNEFLAKIVKTISSLDVKIGVRKHPKKFPLMQINQAELAKAVDHFIRYKLFGQEFDPFEGNHWRVLLLSQKGIVEHVIREVSRAIYELQKSIDVSEATVIKTYFSIVPALRMREKYCLDITKTIYEKQAYPSNKGKLEKAFMEFCDSDSRVQSFVKVNEYYHPFAKISYIREDGILSHYYPDFLAKSNGNVFIIETKGQDRLSQKNVKLKRLATLDWVDRVNQLRPEDRMNANWDYVLLGENAFYNLRDKGASILEVAKMTKNQVEGSLF